jgi:hypothetical protein
MGVSDPYETKQSDWNATYTAEYKKWIGGMTDAERAALPPELLEPVVETKAAGYSDHDMAEDDLASEYPNIIELVEPETAGPPQAAGAVLLQITQEQLNEKIWDVMRRLIGELLCQKNAQLAIEVMALVSGVSFLGDSMTEVGRRNKVGRAAVSKRAVEATAKLNVPPSRAMRTLTARKAYAKARRKRLAENS